MEREPLHVAVFGATGLAGTQVLSALAETSLPIGRVHAYGSARRAPGVDSVDFGDKSLPVSPVARHVGDSFDVAILCVPPKVAALLGPALVQRGVFVVDVGGTSGIEAPVWTGGELPDAALRAGAVRTPSPGAWMLARVLGPLSGVTGVRGTVSLPASAQGRAAMEELGAQVMATFNQTDPPRVEFPEGLAFDTLPSDADEDSWSAAELHVAEEVAALCGLPETRVAVTLATQPLFSGMSASVHVRGVALEAVHVAWSDAEGLRAVRTAARLRPRAWHERADVGWGRLREDPDGDGVHAWLVADNLAGAAGSVAVAALGAAHAAGALGRRA
jgi:aspartate-semialdehyde dehydrogenase